MLAEQTFAFWQEKHDITFPPKVWSIEEVMIWENTQRWWLADPITFARTLSHTLLQLGGVPVPRISVILGEVSKIEDEDSLSWNAATKTSTLWTSDTTLLQNCHTSRMDELYPKEHLQTIKPNFV